MEEDPLSMLGGGGKTPALVTTQKWVNPLLRHDKANAIEFEWLVGVFQQVEQESSRDEKLSIFFQRSHLTDRVHPQSIYPILRLLLPAADSHRTKYGIKLQSLTKMYLEGLRIGANSEDYKMMTEWKQNNANSAPMDPADCIYNALLKRVATHTHKHTVGEVNQLLDDLAATRPHQFRGSASEVDKAKAKGKDGKMEILEKRVLNSYSPLEQKWLIRIILGSNDGLKIGLNTDPVLRRLNENALAKYNECSDLRKACEDSAHLAIEVGIACSPMLSKYFPAAKSTRFGVIGTVENAMRTGQILQPFVMDKKIDGERLIVHQKGRGVLAETKAFSRNTNQSTLVYESLLIDVVKSLAPQVENVILDGEVVVWDRKNCLFFPFGHSMTMTMLEAAERAARLGGGTSINNSSLQIDSDAAEHAYNRHKQKRRNGQPWMGEILRDTSTYGLKFLIFDIILVEGENIDKIIATAASEMLDMYGIPKPPRMFQGQITHFPLALRRLILKKIFTPIEHRVEEIEHLVVTSGNSDTRQDMLSRYFDRTVSKNEEGLVVKNLASPYVFGEESRGKNAGWVKLKPEYNDQTAPLDLLVVGAYIGEGKGFRATGLSSFLLAAKADLNPGETQEAFNANPRFVPVGKVGSGLTHAMLVTMRNMFGSVQQVFKKPGVRGPWAYPGWLTGTPLIPRVALKNDDVPDFIIEPRKSVVMTIKCASITDSSDYPTGFTLRFPRIEAGGIRSDKNFIDVQSVSELQAIRQKGNLTDKEAAGTREKRHSGKQPAKGPTKGQVPEHFKVSKDIVEKKSSLLDGLKFALSDTFETMTQVSSYGFDVTRRGFEKLLKQNGAIVTASPETDCIVLVGTRAEVMAVKNLKAKATHDIVTFRYVVDSLRLGKLAEKKPSYYICQTQASRESFRTAGFDVLGDHLTNETDKEELRMLLSCLDVNGGENMLGPARGHSKSKPAAVKKPKHEDIQSLQRSENEDAERKALEKEHGKAIKEALLLSKRHWRSIAGGLLVEERNVVESAYNVFWVPGNVLYLDLYEGLGSAYPPGASPPAAGCTLVEGPQKQLKYPSAALLALKFILPLHGAVLSSSLHVGVTHVVVDPHDSSRFHLMLERRHQLRRMANCLFEKYFVKSSWAERILQDGVYSPPDQTDLQRIDQELAVVVEEEEE